MAYFSVARRKMVEEQLQERHVDDPRVLEVMCRIPRHEFVDPGMARQAYEDRPLPIGFKQTISQPFIVGFMTAALQLQGGEKVLEIGTGCGYQTAVLCELASHVYSIERITELSNKARKNLYRLGYINFELKIGDGTLGWPERAPFDTILVTAGAPEVPACYLQQLREGGRLVIPIGNEEEQVLVRFRREEKKMVKENLVGCRFVRLVGEHGWELEN
ncbi:MAG: protein-L-isoaspartate(D-aspartate) O-methyltransferase [Deltaproteobacteria bacterium]|nr:protein-L-isoaspartate(D-aspartate) O-methyltransferase [Deltaproteobacteria bacterium]